MGGIAVEDAVDRLAGRDLVLDGVEKADAHARSPHARNDPGSDSLHVVRVAGERPGEHALLDQGATDINGTMSRIGTMAIHDPSATPALSSKSSPPGSPDGAPADRVRMKRLVGPGRAAKRTALEKKRLTRWPRSSIRSDREPDQAEKIGAEVVRKRPFPPAWQIRQIGPKLTESWLSATASAFTNVN